MNVIELFARQRGLSRVFAMVRALAAVRCGGAWLGRLVQPGDIAVISFYGAGLPHRCAAIVSALLNEFVEPLSDRDAGLTRRVVGGFARFWAEASEVPRTAGFHRARKATSGGTRKPPCVLSRGLLKGFKGAIC